MIGNHLSHEVADDHWLLVERFYQTIRENGVAEHIIYDFIPALWGQVRENRHSERIIFDRYFKE